MMRLTQEKINEYVANPFHCPFCDSERIISEDFDSESMSMQISCNNCCRNWKEVFELKAIEQNGE